jgi:MFS family permease
MRQPLRLLIISDLFILSSFALISPIFSIFILKNIGQATIASAGMAVTIQMFTKALFQIIVGKWADEERGNCRELNAMIVGSILISLVPIGYIFCRNVIDVYIIQVLYGLGQAFAYPTWRVLFNRYLNQEKAGYEFGVYDTITSFGIASAAAIGGYLAQNYSFNLLFIIVSVVSFIGSTFLISIFKHEAACPVLLPVGIKLKFRKELVK